MERTGMANLNSNGNPPRTVRFRVGESGSSAQIVQSLSSQFGFDVSKLGRATADDAHELRQFAHSLKIQVDIAKSLTESIRIITDCAVQIEALRKEAIECSLKRKEEIDKLVGHLEVTIAKHQATLQKITQDTQHGIQLAQRKGKLDLTAGKNQFKLQLIAMRKKAFAQMKVNKQVIGAQTTEEVTRIRQQPTEAKARSEERRQFTDHINGKTIKPRAGNPVTAFFN
ncbi:MAG: hypothetical protein H7126_18240 [Candidatus Parcubacteria bacterium]|nr:hypothetical protein [Leptolyngbyaceae cyanobacterium LF-bin-113]